MARKWLVGGAVVCLVTLPMQAVGVAQSGSDASPAPGASSSISPISPTAGREVPGWAGVDVAAARVKSKVGDKDNFGYGLGTGAPPCAFYDLREPEDVGVFDYEPSGGGDESDSWTHTFSVVGTPTKVRLTTYEIFVDPSSPSTIDIDGIVMDFSQGKTAVCDGYPEGGVKHVFVLTGSDALVAADGVVVVTLNENGDDIALDRAKLVVRS